MALGSLSLLFNGWILYYTWSTNRFTSGSGPNNAVLFHRGYLHNGSVRSQSQFNSSDQATVRNDLIIPLRKSITETFFYAFLPFIDIIMQIIQRMKNWIIPTLASCGTMEYGKRDP